MVCKQIANTCHIKSKHTLYQTVHIKGEWNKSFLETKINSSIMFHIKVLNILNKDNILKRSNAHYGLFFILFEKDSTSMVYAK